MVKIIHTPATQLYAHNDDRISVYRKIAEAMTRGDFNRDIPSGNDEIGQLGKSLQKLSNYLQQQAERNQSLTRIMLEINLNLRIKDVLNHVYESFNQLIPYDRISLALIEGKGNKLKLHWVRANYKVQKLREGFSSSIMNCSLSKLGDSGELRVINDLESYYQRHPESHATKAILREGIRSNITCPLISTGSTIGFIFFSSRKKNAYKHFHHELFVQIASQLSIIVEKSKLYKIVRINKQLVEKKKKLEEQVSHDALTGLLNRPAIFDIFHKQLLSAKRQSVGIAAIMIDIDHFKKINDTYGHSTGDTVLCQVAKRLLESARIHEYIGRIGGEEFLVILSPCDKEGAIKAAERLRVAISSKEIDIDDQLVPVTISLGIAINSANILEENQLLRQADEALYLAKNSGRNRVEITIS